jgi:hypothetical protein
MKKIGRLKFTSWEKKEELEKDYELHTKCDTIPFLISNYLD